jgi:Ribbon-helix-helix protein, copG family
MATSRNSAVISFSVDPQLAEEVNRRAQAERRTKSDLFREMWNAFELRGALSRLQADGKLVAARLGLDSDDDIAAYLHER